MKYEAAEIDPHGGLYESVYIKNQEYLSRDHDS